MADAPAAGSDRLVRAMLGDGEARVVAVVATHAAREAARRHQAVAGAAVALARAASAGLLLATLTKDDERVTLQIQGDGPWRGVSADATGAGDVRAFLQHPDVLIPGGAGARVSLAAGVGRRGVLSVVRDLGLKELFTGQTSLVTGEIDEDVEHYLTASEQIASALGCEAVLGEGAAVQASAGLLVQALPGGVGQAEVDEVRAALRDGALYRALAAAPLDPVAMALAVLGRRRPLRVLDVRPVQFRCRCTRERVADMLSLIGEAELDAMIEQDQGAEIACNFCRETYRFTREALEEVRRGAAPHGKS